MTDIIPATRQARRAVVQAGGTPTHWIMTHEVENTLLTLMKPYMTHDPRSVPQRFLDGLPYYIQDDLPEPGFICGEGKLPDPHREQELREAIDMIMRKARDEMEPYRIELAEIEARKPGIAMRPLSTMRFPPLACLVEGTPPSGDSSGEGSDFAAPE